MNKKLLTLLVILVVAAAAVSIVSAADTQKVNGVEFKIPDGYQYDENLASQAADSFGIDASNVGVMKKGDDVIVIAVLDNTQGLTLDQLNDDGYPEKTIEGKSGFLNSDEQSTLFEYIDGDKIVLIEGPDEAAVTSTIVK